MFDVAGEIFAASGSSDMADLNNPALWMPFSPGGVRSISGVEISEDTALSASSVFACVRNLSEDLSKLELLIERYQGNGDKEPDLEHWAYDLMRRPNMETGEFNFRQARWIGAILWGNGYAEIERSNRGQPIALWQLWPRFVLPKRRMGNDPQGQWKQWDLYYEVHHQSTGEISELLPADVLHTPGFSQNGVVGNMIARLGRESIGLTIAAEQFGASFFGNGINMNGVLVHPKSLSQEARQNLRSSISEEHGNPNKGNKMLLLYEDMKYIPTQVEPLKAQAIETRQFQVEEVARWFRMPPHKIGHLMRAQGWSTLESANTDYLTDTLLPWIVREEQELGYKLLGSEWGKGRNQCQFSHQFDTLLRADAKTRAESFAAQFQNGALTQDEWRAKENRGPVPDGKGKTYYVMSNLTPTDRATNPTEPVKPSVAVPKVQKAQSGVFADVVSRMLSRESIAAERAGKKHEIDTSAFELWLGEFMAEQSTMIAAAMSAPVAAMGELLAVGADDLTASISQYAAAHVEESTTAILTAYQSKRLANLQTLWANRPARAGADLAADIASKVTHE